jgi:hypothetical protein
MVMKKAPVVIPLFGRVPGRASRPSRSRVDDGGGLQYVLWKIDRVFRFSMPRRIYRRKGGGRRWARWPHHLVARARGRPHHPMVRLAPGPPPSLLWTPSRVGKNRIFSFVSSNFENISCVAFLKQKIAKNMELAVWHLVTRLVLENA